MLISHQKTVRPPKFKFWILCSGSINMFRDLHGSTNLRPEGGARVKGHCGETLECRITVK